MLNNLDELYSELNGISRDLPVAYDHFEKPQELPYIVYLVTDSNSFAADNHAYYATDNVQIELYSESKNMSLEESVEDVLNDCDVFFSKSEGYLADEQMYMVTYRVSI